MPINDISSTPTTSIKSVQSSNVAKETVATATATATATLRNTGATNPNENTLKKEQDTPKSLQRKVSQLNDFMQNTNRNIQFSIDKQSGETIIKVVDSKTKELIRQIPSQEMLDIRTSLEKNSGLLLQTKV